MDPLPSPSPAAHDPRVAAIVRRHAHDVRNYINSLDLEASLLEELVSDPEAVSSVRRMRSQLNQLEATVKTLSVKFVEPRPVALTASDLLQLWQRQVVGAGDLSQPVEWSTPVEVKVIMIDPGIIVTVLRELVVGARKRCSSRGLSAAVKSTADAVVAELVEPAQAVFAQDEIEECRRLVVGNGGTLEQSRNPVTGEWITRLIFPAIDDGAGGES